MKVKIRLLIDDFKIIKTMDILKGIVLGFITITLLSCSGNDKQTIQVLGKWVQDDRPWLAMQAARSILLVGEDARPLIPDMYQVLEKNLGVQGAPRKYKDFNYAAFTSWSLEWALKELGEEIKLN